MASDDTSGVGGQTVNFDIAANTAAEDRTGYIYINKTASDCDYTLKIKQVGTDGVFYPYWNASEQSKTTSGEFTYSLYVTDTSNAG